ncbi:MAG: glycosyltransferase family 4 protein [Candidatus Aminicenantes bacterium]
MRVDQWIPAFHWGDAIGDTARHMREFLRKQGFSSQIYCLDRDEELKFESEPLNRYPAPGREDVTIYHFALPSSMTPAFKRLNNRRILLYHNITPERFFSGFNQEMARISRLGREELRSLAPYSHSALADSEYNRQELVEMGYQNTDVFPLFVDFRKYNRPANRFDIDVFDDGRTNILFTGRIAPNKKIEDLIRVGFYYKKYISPMVRLIIVGKTHSLPSYYRALIRMADDFYLQPDELCFTGHIRDDSLYALYEISDVFLSMSEHEGFGLPFIECMIFDLPVIAYNAAAVPYTLGGSGILIDHKRPDYVGELVHRVAADRSLRRAVIRTQHRRLETFKKENPEGKLLRHISFSG